MCLSGTLSQVWILRWLIGKASWNSFGEAWNFENAFCIGFVQKIPTFGIWCPIASVHFLSSGAYMSIRIRTRRSSCSKLHFFTIWNFSKRKWNFSIIFSRQRYSESVCQVRTELVYNNGLIQLAGEIAGAIAGRTFEELVSTIQGFGAKNVDSETDSLLFPAGGVTNWYRNDVDHVYPPRRRFGRSGIIFQAVLFPRRETQPIQHGSTKVRNNFFNKRCLPWWCMFEFLDQWYPRRDPAEFCPLQLISSNICNFI